jgi:hypothetical protein
MTGAVVQRMSRLCFAASARTRKIAPIRVGASGRWVAHRMHHFTCMNHRLLPRMRRRLKVHLGDLQTFTADVSPHGFAAELMQTLQPGSELAGSIELCGEKFPFTGQVRWARRGEPRMNIRSRIGVRFLGIPDTFWKLLETAYRPLSGIPA